MSTYIYILANLSVRMEKYEYESLKMFLEDAGLYDVGMTTSEMLDIRNAIDESTSNSIFELQMKMCKEESSIDFLEKDLLHSTLLESVETNNKSNDSAYVSNLGRFSSLENSPTQGQTFSVIAVVHHEFNWSPKKSNYVNTPKNLKRCSELDDEQVERKRRRVVSICSEDEIMSYYEYYRHN